MPPGCRVSFQFDPAQFRYAGTDITIYPGARLVATSEIAIGSHVAIDDFVFVGRHRRLAIGNHVHLASGCSITGGGDCVVCDFAGISSGARIITGTDDFLGAGLTGPTIPEQYRVVLRGSVLIGAHAIVGANAVVLPNITIGEGATIGAGAVVTRDVEPWSVYAGVPARKIKDRRADRIRELEQALLLEEGMPSIVFRDRSVLQALFRS